MLKLAPCKGRDWAHEIVAALSEQTVVVTGTNAAEGVSVRLGPTSYAERTQTLLLDATPATPTFDDAALALALSALGIYGVVSHAVSARTREIGVRAALGATRGHLARMVVADALRPVAAGVMLGLALVLGGSRILASWMFGIVPEPAALALTTLLLVAVGVAASLLPARRAAGVDPIAALRA